MTFLGSLLCADASGRMVHVAPGRKAPRGVAPVVLDALEEGRPVAAGPLAGHVPVPALLNGLFLVRDGRNLGATPDGRVVATGDRTPWEIFHPVEAPPIPRRHGAPEEENARLAARAAELAARGEPVKLYCGCGQAPRKGFLNLDIAVGAPWFSAAHFEDYFIFPFADRRWALPDDCVDYVFHEDFIEHVDQTSQVQFLAESRRVMKPGAWQRVNTPNLIWTMRTRSDFARGLEGVYAGEREWGHLSIYSPASFEEVARMVGFAEVVFTARDGGRSPHAVFDLRPGPDRPDVEGNIFADVRK